MREISSAVGVIESVITSGSALSGTAVKQHHRQLFAELQVVGIAVCIQEATIRPSTWRAIMLLTTCSDQVSSVQRSAAGRALRGTASPAHGKDRKAVVGDSGTTQADGGCGYRAASGRNARLIVLLAGNRRHALARFLRHAQLCHDRSAPGWRSL